MRVVSLKKEDVLPNQYLSRSLGLRYAILRNKSERAVQPSLRLGYVRQLGAFTILAGIPQGRVGADQSMVEHRLVCEVWENARICGLDNHSECKLLVGAPGTSSGESFRQLIQAECISQCVLARHREIKASCNSTRLKSA